MRLSRKCQRMLLAWSVECIPYPPFVLSILYGRGLCCGLRRKNLGKLEARQASLSIGNSACAEKTVAQSWPQELSHMTRCQKLFGDDEIGNGFTGLNGQHRQSLSSPPAMKQQMVHGGLLERQSPRYLQSVWPFQGGNVTPSLQQCALVED